METTKESEIYRNYKKEQKMSHGGVVALCKRYRVSKKQKKMIYNQIMLYRQLYLSKICYFFSKTVLFFVGDSDSSHFYIKRKKITQR